MLIIFNNSNCNYCNCWNNLLTLLPNPNPLTIVSVNLLAILAPWQRSSIWSHIASLIMAMFKPSLQNINAMNIPPDAVRGVLAIVQPSSGQPPRPVVVFLSWYTSNPLYSATPPRWSSLVVITTTLTSVLGPDSLIHFILLLLVVSVSGRGCTIAC